MFLVIGVLALCADAQMLYSKCLVAALFSSGNTAVLTSHIVHFGQCGSVARGFVAVLKVVWFTKME
jgi:hypothetical protein